MESPINQQPSFTVHSFICVRLNKILFHAKINTSREQTNKNTGNPMLNPISCSTIAITMSLTEELKSYVHDNG